MYLFYSRTSKTLSKNNNSWNPSMSGSGARNNGKSKTIQHPQIPYQTNRLQHQAHLMGVKEQCGGGVERIYCLIIEFHSWFPNSTSQHQRTTRKKWGCIAFFPCVILILPVNWIQSQQEGSWVLKEGGGIVFWVDDVATTCYSQAPI